MAGTRRIGVHQAVVDGEVLQMCIVEIRDGIVTGFHIFDGEEPMTEWLGGTVALRYDDEQQLRVYRNDELIK